MNLKSSLLGLLILSFLFLPICEASGEYVIFRAWVSPMYIRNVSAPIKVMAIPFSNNKPLSDMVKISYMIEGLNVNYSYNGTINIHSGRTAIIYLPEMDLGHYFISMYAEYRGVKSRKVEQDFAVSPAPDPYDLYFTPDGSEIHFESLVLNETGEIDPKVTFRLEIYQYEHGIGESLVTTYDGVTNITIKVQESWKTGILIVEVVDRWGWRNGMSIDLAHFRFVGVPVQYDYQYYNREPFASRQPLMIGITIVVILFIIWLMNRVRWKIDGGGR